MNLSISIFIAACVFALASSACAQPLVPTDDSQVIEVLPGANANRLEDRRLRRELAQRPGDATLAVALARRSLARAREQGDPRFAGQALAALSGWSDAQASDEILLLRADLQQHLHDFEGSLRSLQRLVARASGAKNSQAWITLATVRRVQGRYAESDQACRQIEAIGAALHASACLAENAALRGDIEPARDALARLLAAPGVAPGTRAWLLTTQAELEQRAGRPGAADAAFRASLGVTPDSYTRLAYADFLIEQKRPTEALQWLKDEPRSDAVLLRLVLAGRRAGSAQAVSDTHEMRQRLALAGERPEAKLAHGREQAMFALWVEADPIAALALARGNAAHQREPLDLLMFAHAARASADPSALQEVRRLVEEVGLKDRRVEALL